MKKLVLFFLLLMFSSMSANATSYVHYGVGNRPMRVTHGGYHTRSVHQFGSNAMFTPQSAREAGIRNRAIAREKAVTRAIANRGCQNATNLPIVTGNITKPAPVQISRFDKNYQISSGKSYTRNGITYYE